MYNEVLKVLCTHLYIGIKRDQISLKVPFMQSNRAEEAGVEERDIHIDKLNWCLALQICSDLNQPAPQSLCISKMQNDEEIEAVILPLIQRHAILTQSPQ